MIIIETISLGPVVFRVNPLLRLLINIDALSGHSEMISEEL